MEKKILEALKKADSFEKYEFVIDGQRFFISRNLAPVTSFTCGFPGLGAALNGYPLGTQPEAELVARTIAYWYKRLRTLGNLNRKLR